MHVLRFPPSHCSTLKLLGLGGITGMTLDGLEQPELTCWLMDKTDPDTMCITVSPEKKIKITPRVIDIVIGTGFGFEDICLPENKVMKAALKSLTQELGLSPNSRVSCDRLIREIGNGSTTIT
ncbi:hypothetical protein E2562_038370 [Oryza meyeriana var. granulata]|uniref:Uncharacterized protein n=1 Tax=Oryza meyeriana var. granulata TaxID=110450 RepID=A0A6G1F2B0_9ORYZ|nr:hypothetical protein E2562_038370 [Oryza meyeriana var. granulata]